MGANKKISQLTNSGALGGTEELPVVQSGTTVKTTLNDVSIWLDSVYDLFNVVRKGAITTNYILKASGTDTATNSQISDDGTTVTITTPTGDVNVYVDDTGAVLETANGSVNVQSAKTSIVHSTGIELNSPSVKVNQLTASQIVETDASKNLVSVAKATGYNLALGTTAGTVAEGSNVTTVYKLGTTITTTSTSSISISDFTIPLDASSEYLIEGTLFLACSGTGGQKIGITVPSGSTFAVFFQGRGGSATAYAENALSTSGTVTPAMQTFVNGGMQVKFNCQLVTSTTAGNLTIQLQAGVSGQTTSLYPIGSYVKKSKI